MSTQTKPQHCINKRLLCPSLASTLRNPILPKAVSKRKYVGLNEPNFDEDPEKKRPDAGHEYDPDADYIYDARKYFDPAKYRELVANQEDKKQKQKDKQQKFYYKAQKKFYYKAFRGHSRRYYHNRYCADSGYLSVSYDNVGTERLGSLSPASSLNSQFAVYDAEDDNNDDDDDELHDVDSHPSRHHKKSKKHKHPKHGSCTSKSSHKHAKRKKSDVNDKKHKKKRKRKKSSDRSGMSLHHNHEDQSVSSDKHCRKLRHRSRHRSK